MKKNYIIVDFKVESTWEFGREFCKYSNYNWKIDGYNNCGIITGKFTEVKRYILYFLIGIKYFLIRRRIGTMLSYQQFYGIIFAWFSRIFHTRKLCKMVIMTFIYKPKKGLIGKLYNWFIKYAVESIYIDKIICFSKSECQLYKQHFRTDEDKFIATSLGKKAHGFSIEESEEEYILSAGRSNRDYDFLIKTFEDTDYNLKIVADILTTQMKNISSKRIQIYDHTFGKDYFDILRHSRIVVLPLDNPNISSGQLVLLQAMEMGIPVVICGSNVMDEYIEDGYNGFIVEKDEQKLLKLVEQIWSDKGTYSKVSENAKRFYKEHGSVQAMAKNIAAIVDKV